MIRRIAFLLAVLLGLSLPAQPAFASDRMAGCDNWYEIFVRSFQDSDGDGLGDLRGVLDRLDYIEKLNMTGIWLMPIMPSPSYHKYDVTDYKSVDPEYGTLEDLTALVAGCHARGIRVILDLPINHTSTQHPWFQAAAQALCSGDEAEQHIGWYNFSRDPSGNMAPLSDSGWHYEEQFAGGGMPDLNLDSDAVREEIRAVLAFWLNECGVDGFRLDAVTSFFSDHTDQNIAFLRWLKQTCEELKPGSFLVGEAWTGLKQIAEYYESGVDAFFLFPVSQAEGSLVKAIRSKKPAEAFIKAVDSVRAAIPQGLLAPFLGNHDTGRAVGSLQARQDPAKAKFAEGLLALYGGSSFTYYGEEIGMVGAGADPNKRLAMYWNDGDMTDQPPGTDKIEYAYPCADDQLADPASLYWYVSAANALRLRYPAIAAGQTQWVYNDTHVLLMRRVHEDQSVLIAINFSGSEAREMPLPAEGMTVKEALLTGEESPVLSGVSLTLPPYAIAVIGE